MYQSHGRHADPPPHHDDGQEYARSIFLEQDVGQRLEDGVGDEEDGEGRVVLAICQVEIFLQTVDFGVAYGGPTEVTVSCLMVFFPLS